MTETKFTPGSWHVGRDADEDIGFGWFVGGGGHCRANIVGPINHTEANAHLIAAAPDLYEALDKIVTRYHKGEDIYGWIDVASIALAKARGEQ